MRRLILFPPQEFRSDIDRAAWQIKSRDLLCFAFGFSVRALLPRLPREKMFLNVLPDGKSVSGDDGDCGLGHIKYENGAVKNSVGGRQPVGRRAVAGIPDSKPA